MLASFCLTAVERSSHALGFCETMAGRGHTIAALLPRVGGIHGFGSLSFTHNSEELLKHVKRKVAPFAWSAVEAKPFGFDAVANADDLQWRIVHLNLPWRKAGSFTGFHPGTWRRSGSPSDDSRCTRQHTCIKG